MNVFLFVTACLAAPATIHTHDKDFTEADLAATTSSSDKWTLLASIGVILALMGFVIFFFLGVYVGSAVTRREVAAIVIRANSNADNRGAIASTFSHSTSMATRMPVPIEQPRAVQQPQQAPPPLPLQMSSYNDSFADPYRIKKH